jgi:mitochondrial fission protein ELM1
MADDQGLSVAKNPNGGKDDTGKAGAVTAPRAWALLGDKPGDNAQVLALAGALGLPFAPRKLAFCSAYRLWNLALGASLTSLDRARSDALEPPWPDLVIAIGRRSVPVARWIKARSGGRTRLVHLGRPRAPYAWFDLIVTTPQYALPRRANMVDLLLPLVPERRAGTGGFDDLPRPRVALLAGGDVGPWRFDAALAARLGADASGLAQRLGGALLVATSRRTSVAAAAALVAAIGAPARVHRFGQGSDYDAIVGAADGFVVTADSVSMMADAAATGRPLLLAPVGHRPTALQRLAEAFQAVPGYDAAVDLGLIARPRALPRVAAALIASGHARWLGADADLAPPAVVYDATAARARVVARVRALIDRAEERP